MDKITTEVELAELGGKITTEAELREFFQKVISKYVTGDNLYEIMKAFEKKAEESTGMKKTVNRSIANGFKMALGKV